MKQRKCKKYLPEEKFAAMKTENTSKKMRWRLKSADMTDGMRHWVKFSFACAFSRFKVVCTAEI